MESILTFGSGNNVELLVLFNCLICDKSLNFEEDSYKSIYHSYMTTSHRISSQYLTFLFGEDCLSKKKSDMMCLHCFANLDNLDFLEYRLAEEKNKFILKYQNNLKDEPSSEKCHSPEVQLNNQTCVINGPKDDSGHLDRILEKMPSLLPFELVKPQKKLISKPPALLEVVQESSGYETNLTSFINKSLNDCSIAVRKSVRHNKKSLLRSSMNNDQKNSNLLNELCVGKSKPKQSSLEIKDHSSFAKEQQNEIKTTLIKMSCNLCLKAFKTSIALRCHLLNTHGVSHSEADSIVMKSLILSNEIVRSTILNTICPWCQTSHRDHKAYLEHIEDHQENAFKEYLQLTSSIDHASNMGDFSCLLCNEKCSNIISLRQHIPHHVYGLSCCPLCQVTYSTRMQFIGHLEFFHKEYVMKCAECSEEFTEYLPFEHHMLIAHHFHLVKTCSICNKFMLERDLKGRNSSNDAVCKKCYPLNSSQSVWKCSECEYTSKYYGSYVTHKIGHLFGSHQCTLCKQKFLHGESLRTHLTESHPFLNNLECGYCKKNLKNYDNYLKHLKFKHPDSLEIQNSSTLTCEICLKGFSNKIILRYHMKTHNHPQKCKICGAKIHNLSLHMNLHKKKLQYTCSDCNVCFLSNSSLKSHINRVHLKHQQYKNKCSLCHKGFIYPADLKRHIKTVHEGQRNYKCHYCGSTFKSKGTLTYHERKHTGEKPHQCGLCNAAFETPTLLKGHALKVHNAQYKGIYFKGNSKNTQTSPLDNKANTTNEVPYMVHIDVPSTMLYETVTELNEMPSPRNTENIDSFLPDE